MRKFFDWLEIQYLNSIPDWAIIATASVVLGALFVGYVWKLVRAAMACPRCGGKITLIKTDEEKQKDHWACALSCGWEMQKMFN